MGTYLIVASLTMILVNDAGWTAIRCTPNVARTDNEAEGAVPRVYQPDHTSGIRRRLKAILLYFVTGAAVVSTGAVVLAIIATQLGDEGRTLVTVAWVVVVVALLVAALGLVMTLFLYLRYRRRRADLDAAGAEAEGELLARIHLATRDEG